MRDDGWTWELASNAQDDLDSLSPDVQDRIIEKGEKLDDRLGVNEGGVDLERTGQVGDAEFGFSGAR